MKNNNKTNAPASNQKPATAQQTGKTPAGSFGGNKPAQGQKAPQKK